MVDTTLFAPVTERRYLAFDSLIAEAHESEVGRPSAAAAAGQGPSTKKALEEESREAAHDMIIAYLIREGHAETAKTMITAAAANTTPAKSGALDSAEKRRAIYHAALSSLDIRKRVIQLIKNGLIKAAIDMCADQLPVLLSHEGAGDISTSDQHTAIVDLAFQLHCQYFIECIRSQDNTAALHYARTILIKYSKQRQSCELYLMKLFPLIAYPDPFTSPISHFLAQTQRDDVAEAINTAILLSQAAQHDKSLESVIQHLTLLHEEMRVKEKIK